MSRLTAIEIKNLMEAYQEVYSHQKLTEEEQNQLFMIEWCNAMIDEGLIDGDVVDEEGILDENVWTKVGQAVQRYGPRAMELARKVTGFGLGPSSGGKRRIITTGTGTVVATDPKKASHQVSSAVTRTASAVNRGVRAASGQAVPSATEQQPRLGLTPQGTIRVR